MCFFISVIVFLSSEWFFFILFSSLLICPLCSPILFPSSVNILITNTLNYSSGKLFISVSLVVFSGFFFFLVLSIETNSSEALAPQRFSPFGDLDEIQAERE